MERRSSPGFDYGYLRFMITKYAAGKQNFKQSCLVGENLSGQDEVIGNILQK